MASAAGWLLEQSMALLGQALLRNYKWVGSLGSVPEAGVCVCVTFLPIISLRRFLKVLENRTNLWTIGEMGEREESREKEEERGVLAKEEDRTAG